MNTRTAGKPSPAATVGAHLVEAREAIDAAFGDGHAARHPELVAAFLQAAAIESLAAAGCDTAGQALHVATRIAHETNETILKLKPRIFG